MVTFINISHKKTMHEISLIINFRKINMVADENLTVPQSIL